MFRSGEDVLLDDMTACELEEKLGVKIRIVPVSGYDFVEALID